MKKVTNKIIRVNAVYLFDQCRKLGISCSDDLTYGYVQDESCEDICVGDLAKFDGRLKEDNKYQIEKIEKINNPNLDDYLSVHQIPDAIKAEYKDFKKILKSISDNDLIGLMKNFVNNRKLFVRFLEYPCSIKSHDARRHGLFLHTYRIVSHIEKMDLEKNLKNFCIVGAVFHDIGKVFTLQNYIEKSRIIVYASIVGHKQNSVDIFDSLAERVKNLSDKKRQIIRNIILNTHNMDYDVPKTLPGKIVSELDKLDAGISDIKDKDKQHSAGNYYRTGYDKKVYFKAM